MRGRIATPIGFSDVLYRLPLCYIMLESHAVNMATDTFITSFVFLSFLRINLPFTA